MWRTGLVALRHVGSSQTRARTCVPCIGRRIVNHRATREAQQTGLLKKPLLILSLAGLQPPGAHSHPDAFPAASGLAGSAPASPSRLLSAAWHALCLERPAVLQLRACESLLCYQPRDSITVIYPGNGDNDSSSPTGALGGLS